MLEYKMDYLNLLPDDVLGIINRQVKEDYIITRRLERKENRRLNREQRKKAYRREILLLRFVLLYRRLLRKIYMDKIKFLYNYGEWKYLEFRIRRIYERGGKRDYQYSVVNLILEELIPIDRIMYDKSI